MATTKKKRGLSVEHKVRTAGELAESHVKRTFGLSEPHIEVKAAKKRNWHVVVSLAQLERNAGKSYCVVVYDRGMKLNKRAKRRVARVEQPIEQAFEQPLEFIFIDGVVLARQVIRQRHQIRAIMSTRRLDVRFYAYLSINQLRELAGGNYPLDGHTVYGTPPAKLEETDGVQF